MKPLGLLFPFLLLPCLLLSACHRVEIRTVEILVPQMESEESARQVADALNAYTSFGVVHEVTADFTQRIVRITYDSTLAALKNFEYVIARSGFDANDTRAADVARKTAPESAP